jgi:hypothetical protein
LLFTHHAECFEQKELDRNFAFPTERQPQRMSLFFLFETSVVTSATPRAVASQTRFNSRRKRTGILFLEGGGLII